MEIKEHTSDANQSSVLELRLNRALDFVISLKINRGPVLK
jgi:hypothetical protein